MSATESLLFLPGDDPINRVRHFVRNPALAELVERFGGTWPQGNLDKVVDELHEFSEVWNYRKGAGRLDIKAGELAGVEEIKRAIGDLGLHGPTTPVRRHFDWALVLGGLAMGCRGRVGYLRSLMDDGMFTLGGICMLGSYRALLEGELPTAAEYAPDATTEVDLLLELADQTFPDDTSWDITTSGDRVAAPRSAGLHAQRDSRLPAHVFASPSSDPERGFANTADTYVQITDTLLFAPGTRLLVVTTHHYATFQHFDAVRVLGIPNGLEVETIGTPVTKSGMDYSVEQYLQEVRSTLRACADLLASEAERRDRDK